MHTRPVVVLGLLGVALSFGCKIGPHHSHHESHAGSNCGCSHNSDSNCDCCDSDVPDSEWANLKSVWFYSNNYAGGGAPKSTYWRVKIPGQPEVISLPATIGDNAAYEIAHFASPEAGAAVVRDTDGASAHVLRYDPASNAWVDVLRVTKPLVINAMIDRDADSPNAAVVFVHSWTDGSLVAAMAITNRTTWTHTLWSVVSVPGVAPVERYVSFGANNVALAPEARTSVFLVGAKTPYQLRAVAISAAGISPQRTFALALGTVDGAVSSTEILSVTGRFYSPGYTGLDDFWLGDCDADGYIKPNRYCRGTSCESPQFGAPSPAYSQPYSFVSASETPEPWIKIADMRQSPPSLHYIALPTISTEMRVDVFYPDPDDVDSIRLVTYDSDIAFKPIEYTYNLPSRVISEAPDPNQLDLRGYFADPEVLKFWHYDPPLPLFVFYPR